MRTAVAALALVACTRRPPAPAAPVAVARDAAVAAADAAPRCERASAASTCGTPADADVRWEGSSVCAASRAPDGVVTVAHYAVAEPEGAWSHMLSGLWYDAARGAFFAVRDNDPRVVWLRPDARFARWTGGFTEVGVAPHGSLEALTGLDGGLLVADEDDARHAPPGPHVFAAGGDGGPAGAALAVPAHFGRACDNSGFEALSATPDGRHLVVANERALAGDAPGLVRVLVTDRASGAAREVAYRLGPGCWCDGASDLGLSDLVALSADRLLTVERAWRRDQGNCVRVHLVDLSGAPDVLGVERLGDGVVTARKRMLFDAATLPRDAGLAPAAGQTHPAMGNYEGMALGPCLPDGRRALVLVSDDNDDWVRAHDAGAQARRILVLGARGL